MEARKLGRTELRLSAITFGGWAIGGWGLGPADEETAVRAVRTAIDAGITSIDTAPVYGFGRSERLIGRAIAGRRDEVLLMTKVGLVWDDDRGPLAFQTQDEHGRHLDVHYNLRPWSVRAEVERSLKRMGVERIDLVQCHWPDPVTRIPETMAALVDLREEGKLGEIGVSNFSVERLDSAREALAPVPLASLQARYSLVAPEIEKDLLPWCREHEIGVLAYSPLEQGLLTGKVGPERSFGADDGRSRRGTFRADHRALVNETLQRVVSPIASRHGVTVAQVVIAWTVAQPGITSVLVGARTPEQARENAAAGELRLDGGELATIRSAFDALRGETGAQPGLLGRVARRLLGR